jgi:acetolactate synthase I/II/III large subunit
LDQDLPLSGADFVAEFIAQHCFPNVFLVTGGACAFIVDAIGRNSDTKFTCFQNEQGASMAADAIWRTRRQVGVTLATSGPGATNLITGIACSWFDSIPALHITGQVNQNESKDFLHANVRQAGFQETDIVSMVKPITKFAHKVTSIDDLLVTLPKALEIATSGRMGPVLIDIPMDVQKASIDAVAFKQALSRDSNIRSQNFDFANENFDNFFKDSKRPLLILGAGLLPGETLIEVQKWCEANLVPYVASWGALPSLDSGGKLFQGALGVYGSRHANWVVQSADKILVLGSRLDNRQRTGNASAFAPFSEILVVDIDEEELKKFKRDKNYHTLKMDLKFAIDLLHFFKPIEDVKPWADELSERVKNTESGFKYSTKIDQLNPYESIIEMQKFIPTGSIAVSDCGANLCWVYQSWKPGKSFLFTAGGNSPMGYSLPAAIGAQIANPDKKVICFIGDGGLQMNLQELQTVISLNLPITIVIQNNFGYGIIKQFQDSYFEGRHFATGEGYSVPNFEAIGIAYGFKYTRVTKLDQISESLTVTGPNIVELVYPSESLISPKTEMNRFIHDQYPYIDDDLIQSLKFSYPERPSELSDTSNPTV